VPFGTLLKIALFALLVVIAIRLWPIILMIFCAALLAVMLDPIVGWLERHHVRRSFGIAVVSLLVFGSVVAFVVFIVPTMVTQLREIVRDLPALRQEAFHRFPILRQVPPLPKAQQFIGRGFAMSVTVIEGITVFLFVLVLAIYLIVEGRTAFEWLVSFAPKEQRPRWRKTVIEIAGVMRAFMRGQLITSALCGGWALLVLTVLRVPAPLPLAVIAAIADLIPVVGTILMIAPAAAMALTRSASLSLLVIAAYLVYHLVESYFIVPRVYGREMRLSTLTVLVGIAVGGVLQGPIGAILILPVVAAYPIIERIWLRDELPSDTVTRHEAIES
jgi:predicted PurR-regulated permease PerM